MCKWSKRPSDPSLQLRIRLGDSEATSVHQHLSFIWVIGRVLSEVLIELLHTAQEILTALASSGRCFTFLGHQSLLVANNIVVVLSVINMIKQQLVCDILGAGKHRHEISLSVDSDVRHIRLMVFGNTPVSHGSQTKTRVQLLHVHDMTAHVDGPRVILFLYRLGHEISFLNAKSQALLTFSSSVSSTSIGNTSASLSSSRCLLKFCLLDLSQLDLTEGFISSKFLVPALKFVSHLIHLTTLFSSQGLINSLQLSSMSREHGIDVFLVHILEKLFLLVAELLSFERILLLFELIKELHFLLFHFVLPVVHAVLALHKRLKFGLFISFQLVHPLLLVAVSLASEALEFFLTIVHLLLQVLLDSSVIFAGILKQPLEHNHLFLCLTVLQKLLLL